MSDADSGTGVPSPSQWAMEQYIASNASRVAIDPPAASSYGPYSNRNSVLQQIGENQFPFEDSELIIKSFERSIANNHVRASYYQGNELREPVSSALEPMVSIVFLPGPDRMAVAAL